MSAPTLRELRKHAIEQGGEVEFDGDTQCYRAIAPDGQRWEGDLKEYVAVFGGGFIGNGATMAQAREDLYERLTDTWLADATDDQLADIEDVEAEDRAAGTSIEEEPDMRNYRQRMCKWCGLYGGGYDCRQPRCVPIENREALTRFKEANGRFWKRELRECWMNASYPGVDPQDISLLQQVRNNWPNCIDQV